MFHNGLPGLVLELQRGHNRWEVVTIDFDSVAVDFIDEPLSKKLITEGEYREWSKKKFASQLIDKD